MSPLVSEERPDSGFELPVVLPLPVPPVNAPVIVVTRPATGAAGLLPVVVALAGGLTAPVMVETSPATGASGFAVVPPALDEPSEPVRVVEPTVPVTLDEPRVPLTLDEPGAPVSVEVKPVSGASGFIIAPLPPAWR